jgi:hypothetical protein
MELNWRTPGFRIVLHKVKSIVTAFDLPPRLSSSQYQYHFLPRSPYSSTFMIESVDFSEKLVTFYQSLWCHIQDISV